MKTKWHALPVVAQFCSVGFGEYGKISTISPLVGQECLPIATGIQFPWKPKVVACLFSKLKMKEWLGIKGK
ncbi:hypothetical protein H671_4g11348 [Cricetulus griseus]|nr:hypothetical protein H671_4g11348 [Cricetulus griseus]